MRVAMVDPSLFTLQYDASLARALTDAGCDVTLHARGLQPTDGKAEAISVWSGFYPLSESRAVRALPKPLRLSVKSMDHLASMARLWRHLRRMRPDVIHFQWLPLPVMDRAFLAPFRRLAPLVMTVHDTNPFNGDPSASVQRLGVRGLLAGFQQLIVHTSQGKARLVEQGIAAEKLAIVPHGSSPVRLLRDDAMTGDITFLLFGKLKPYKGADSLIDAYAALPRALRQQSRLRIVGRPYMDLGPLYARVDAAGLRDRISIEPRFVTDEELPSLLGPGTVMVFPYREIEASGVLFQAIEYGRPIIASKMGAFAEILQDGVHGRLVPPGDAAALTAALAALLTDRGFAAAAAMSVRRLAGELCSWHEAALGTISVYQAARDAA